MTDDLKTLLLTPRAEARAEDTIELEAGTIRVRALTRTDVLKASEITDPVRQEQMILARAMVDPPMTEADVKQWQEVGSAGDLGLVVDKVRELSGFRG